MDRMAQALSLREVADLLAKRAVVGTQTRFFKSYANVVTGEALVDTMLVLQLALTDEDAVSLGNELIGAGFLIHAKDATQPFKNKEHSLYRFWIHGGSGAEGEKLVSPKLRLASLDSARRRGLLNSARSTQSQTPRTPVSVPPSVAEPMSSSRGEALSARFEEAAVGTSATPTPPPLPSSAPSSQAEDPALAPAAAAAAAADADADTASAQVEEAAISAITAGFPETDQPAQNGEDHSPLTTESDPSATATPPTAADADMATSAATSSLDSHEAACAATEELEVSPSLSSEQPAIAAAVPTVKSPSRSPTKIEEASPKPSESVDVTATPKTPYPFPVVRLPESALEEETDTFSLNGSGSAEMKKKHFPAASRTSMQQLQPQQQQQQSSFVGPTLLLILAIIGLLTTLCLLRGIGLSVSNYGSADNEAAPSPLFEPFRQYFLSLLPASLADQITAMRG